MTYRVGDEVLVRAKLIEKTEDGSWRIQVPANSYTYRVRNSSIHGLAPRPETDWSKVPMGARVRVRIGNERISGRLVSFDSRSPEGPFQVLLGIRISATWHDNCELVEEGDE